MVRTICDSCQLEEVCKYKEKVTEIQERIEEIHLDIIVNVEMNCRHNDKYK